MIEFGIKALLIIFITLVILPILGICMCIPILNLFVYKFMRGLYV